jgi:hypothetical protein
VTTRRGFRRAGEVAAFVATATATAVAVRSWVSLRRVRLTSLTTD